MSPLAKGLFHRMILQSHARYPRDPVLFEVATGYKTLQEAEAERRAVHGAAGRASLQELRALPWQKLIDGARRRTAADHVVDGYFVPHNYADTYAARRAGQRLRHRRLQQG